MAGFADIFVFVAMGIIYYVFLRAIGWFGRSEDGSMSDADEEASTLYLLPYRDPVCGRRICGPEANHESEYFGCTYHFCSEKCLRIFDLNPGRYARHSARA